jgi:HSF-type DNA-binding
MERLISLTMASANDKAIMNENQGELEVIPESVGLGPNNTSHAGLTALLNAVTLHISKSDEEKNNDHSANLPSKSTGTQSDGTLHQDDSFATTTPTMVPEVHELQKNTFPGILMTLLLDPGNSDVITFLPDGKYFALRCDTFACKIMREVFNMVEYETFTEELSSWGFARVETKRPGIEVYRHKLFRKGEWTLCDQMKQHEPGTEQTDVSYKSGYASRSSSMSEDDPTRTERSNLEANKRRLSPSASFTANNGSSSKVCTRVHSSDEESSFSGDQRQKHDRDLRTTALAITTAKLNIRETDDREFPLVQQAVVGATHTIVTDAIECLLRDEDHTKQTFEKHASELSKSTLPGLVPIAKQLFSLEGKIPSQLGTMAKNEPEG